MNKNMTEPRMRRLLALLVLTAMVAGACGGQEDTLDDQVTSTDDATATPAVAETLDETPSAVQTADEEGNETDDAEPVTVETETTAVEAASCFADQTATFVVSFGAGGGYDTIARLLSPSLEEELGGTVIVENQAGAGGLLALNNLLTSDEADLRFGFFTGQGIVGSVLGEADGADFDLSDFQFIGRVAADQRVMATGGSSEYETIEQAQEASGLQYATAGPGASDYIDATVLVSLLELDAEIITGFEGSAETEIALTSGDTDLASGTVGSRLSALESGDHRPLLSLGSQRIDGFPDVPALTELDLGEEKQAIAEAYDALQEMGRMVWASPNMPDECAQELSAALEAVVTDPDVVAQMEATDQEVDFRTGEEMRETFQSLLDSPEGFTSLLREAYSAG